MRVLLVVVAVVGMLGVAPASTAEAQVFPYCNPGQSPRFLFGFATLKAQLGARMGEPVECEHPNSANGDTLQKTTTGLAFYRKSTNIPTFTDGWRHWALTAQGLVSWEGTSVDPPGVAAPAPTRPGPAPAPASASPRASPTTLDVFVRGVVGDIGTYWRDLFARAGVPYAEPRVVSVARAQPASTACGYGLLDGPAYCLMDRTIYLDVGFFEADWSSDQDFAIAVVIAHEWGHHIQNLLGIVHRYTIGHELQADCMAGMFAKHASDRGWVDDEDIFEGVFRSGRSGDPPWYPARGPAAHGSPDQRVRAFLDGFRNICLSDY